MTDFTPARFALFVEIPGERVGQTKGTTYRRRIGNYRTRQDAQNAAEADALLMERYGSMEVMLGLPTPGGRVYRIFEATGWTEIK